VPVDRRGENELRAEFRAAHGFADHDVVGLYVGRINPIDQPYKGTAELLDLVPRLRSKHPELKWVMVGLGTEKDEEMCRRAGIVPLLNHPDWRMRQVFCGCDLYATASKWEGFDLPIMEAAYFGKPVVGYRLAAHPEVVNDGVSGFLVRAREEFQGRIEQLVTDKQLRESMGAEGRKWASHFTWRKCAEQFEGMFQELLNRPSG
jgi:glycosyltransferase involved in cell wall biosynthesis